MDSLNQILYRMIKLYPEIDDAKRITKQLDLPGHNIKWERSLINVWFDVIGLIEGSKKMDGFIEIVEKENGTQDVFIGIKKIKQVSIYSTTISFSDVDDEIKEVLATRKEITDAITYLTSVLYKKDDEQKFRLAQLYVQCFETVKEIELGTLSILDGYRYLNQIWVNIVRLFVNSNEEKLGNGHRT